MDRRATIDVLNKLLETLTGSLPVYLQSSRPWARRNDEPILDVIGRIAADQEHYAARVTEAIYALDGSPRPGRFPMPFAQLHDLALPFIARKVLELHRRDVDAIGRSGEALAESPEHRELAEEIHANAEGHLENLQEVLAGATATP